MSVERRLDKIEKSLTPLGCVLVWLKEAQACGTFLDGAAEFLHKPEACPWGMVRQALGKTAGGKQLQHSTMRDARFLYLLVIEANVAVLTETQSIGRELQHIFLWARTIPALQPEINAALIRQLDIWRAQLLEVVSDLLLLEQSVLEVEKSHFDNHSIRFWTLMRC